MNFEAPQKGRRIIHYPFWKKSSVLHESTEKETIFSTPCFDKKVHPTFQMIYHKVQTALA